MHEVTFDSNLLDGGYLYCPKEYADKNARYKVIALLPDENATSAEIESNTIQDLGEEFLSEDEKSYCFSLKNA
jgi:hypothetical protein